MGANDAINLQIKAEQRLDASKKCSSLAVATGPMNSTQMQFRDEAESYFGRDEDEEATESLEQRGDDDDDFDDDRSISKASGVGRPRRTPKYNVMGSGDGDSDL